MAERPPRTRREARDLGTDETEEPSTDQAAAAKRAKAEFIGRTVAIFIMPLVFVGMMITSYLGTMHSPTANDMPIVVSGSSAKADDARFAINGSEPDAFDIEVTDDAYSAREKVYDREASAAVIVKGDTATIVTASGAGVQQSTTVEQLITPALQDEGLKVTTDDIVPLPDNDPTGMAAMFLMTAIVMAGYMPFSVLRTNSPELLKFKRIVPILAGWSTAIAALVWTVACPILDVVDVKDTVAVLGIAWLGIFAISSVQLFITRLVGAMGVIIGILFLMALGMPSSNMAMPVYTMPKFFRFTHEFLPMPAIGESLRSVLYFNGDGVTGHLLVLALGAVAGLLLTKVYDHFYAKRNSHPVPLDVNVPAIHGGRRPDSKVIRYISLTLFPLAMVTMMITFMLGAMHSPTPKDMPVAVVGASTEQAEDTIKQLDEQMDGKFEFTALGDKGEAKRLVENRDEVAALVLPSEKNSDFELLANQAGNNASYRVAVQVFEQVASAQDAELTVDNLAPLPDRDKNGVVVMYVAMGWILAGFMVVIVAANANPWTRPLKRMLPIIVAYAPFMSLVVALIAGPITGAVDGHFAALWGAGTLAIACISMFAMVFERLIGMFAIIPVIGTLMFAGVPSSNGALSQYMVPKFFSTLHDFLPMAASVETIRSILYFDGDVVTEHLQVLGLWGLVSLALVFLIDGIKPPRTEHDFGNLHLEREREIAKEQRKQALALGMSPSAQNPDDEEAAEDSSHSRGSHQTVQGTIVNDEPGAQQSERRAPTAGDGQTRSRESAEDEIPSTV
ncbi:ABC transporter permease [Brevibacterium spongiae]|uniref:ABC transporter permease n=1 Tax=Brevibacterium spongiae TaxID=2909672 RepID=A0ABY5SU25_9MICO|nr:ABC transporter permease [Brevibacterium spongiae]UVI37376.1 ABC transporter permease [Brevibacterium spongiae]